MVGNGRQAKPTVGNRRQYCANTVHFATLSYALLYFPVLSYALYYALYNKFVTFLAFLWLIQLVILLLSINHFLLRYSSDKLESFVFILQVWSVGKLLFWPMRQ